jgi:MFS family permease
LLLWLPLGYALRHHIAATRPDQNMHSALGLMKERRFLPLFVTQFLGAFNDNLFKQMMVYFVTYHVLHDPKAEFGFTAIATALSLIPFFLLSALAGQLADTNDKSRIIRIVKTVEILIMIGGCAGLILARNGLTTIGIGMMLGAVLALGIHSTFFGPIKYAILPQHLDADDVLGGTGLIEASTYLAILLGTIAAGWLSVDAAAVVAVALAVVGRLTAMKVPPAPRAGARLEINYNPFTSSWRLVNATMHIPRLFLAICAISFFWMIGAIVIATFPPLVKNILFADQRVASTLNALFSIGIAVGSVAINRMLRGRVSARFAPASVIAMGLLFVLFSTLMRAWPAPETGHLYNWIEFAALPRTIPLVATLMAIAVTGGMFVVPLYAFLTTTVTSDQTARTVAANNVVNSGAMVVGLSFVIGLAAIGVSPLGTLLVVAAMCLGAAWIAQKLHQACD